MLGRIVDYFDLQSGRRTRAGDYQGLTERQYAPVLPQYFAVALGVVADPVLRQYIETKSFALDVPSIAAGTGFALLMAIAILPAVYKNAFDPDKPILVQLCALFSSGLGWQSLFQAGATAIT
jgi:hypothetical protein